MDSTSDYRRGAFYLLEDAIGEVMLVNPAHAGNVPGRKTDALDAAWCANRPSTGYCGPRSCLWGSENVDRA
ncbi:hypothetical protein [Actinospica sp.]|jgi:hypothetical protein|uniref:hypothetical protein n=1 Tax=Actinospica sp. TaxID=1872142 RepID=UPI002BB8DED6|nr:hypothetical protein [Actinospica sp.]HWG26489.1 hypothetical protein [Actinospica sp.]